MEIIEKYFADFSDLQKEQFAKLQALYTHWNAQINVISRKDIDGLYAKHVLHSLTIATTFDFAEGDRIIDIGTGGGFPGIPLAIFFPEAQFLLADSIRKKLTVVQAVVDSLGLKNVSTFWGRVEDYKEKNSFDYAVSRAVAPLGDLWRWAKPLIRKGGQGELHHGLICLKGGDLHQEISDSGCKPMMWNVFDLFEEEYFKDKHMLFVRK